jgi:photosystem II stability/assembly factor-like uncharacterized protein
VGTPSLRAARGWLKATSLGIGGAFRSNSSETSLLSRTPPNRPWRALLPAAAALALCSGCGSHSGLQQIEPDHTVTGHVTRASAAALGRRIPWAVAFVDLRHGFVGTAGGQLLATSDGGARWRLIGHRRVVALSFVDRRRGYALTSVGTAIATRDGGRTWFPLRLPHKAAPGGPRGPFPGAIEFVDANHGWVELSDGRLYSTADGGSSWTRLKISCDFVIGGISLVDARRGYLICGGQPATIQQEKELYATADGGTTWRLVAAVHFFGGPKPRPNGLPGSGHAAGLDFATTRRGLLVTSRGGIAVTNDGGRTWRSRLFTDDASTVSSTSWAGANRIFAAYNGGNGSGLLRSDDSGGHWRQVYPRGSGPPLGPIAFAAAKRGLGAGPGGMFGHGSDLVATADGGRSWRPIGRVPARHALRELIRVPGGLWAVGTWVGRRTQLARSSEGGRSWRKISAPALSTPAWAWFRSRNEGIVTDLRKTFRTTDGGRTWREGGLSDTPRLFAAANNELLWSRDGGASWRHVGLPTGIEGFDVSTLDRDHRWVFGNRCARGRCRGVILRTGDAGRRWDLIELPVVLIGSVSFVTPKIGYLNADGLYRTEDGGESWRQIVPR